MGRSRVRGAVTRGGRLWFGLMIVYKREGLHGQLHQLVREGVCRVGVCRVEVSLGERGGRVRIGARGVQRRGSFVSSMGVGFTGRLVEWGLVGANMDSKPLCLRAVTCNCGVARIISNCLGQG